MVRPTFHHHGPFRDLDLAGGAGGAGPFGDLVRLGWTGDDRFEHPYGDGLTAEGLRFAAPVG